MDERFRRHALLEEFRDESRGQLDLLDRALLEIESGGSLEEERRLVLLRALHTLKGNSGMIGLRGIADQVHTIEALLRAEGADQIRERLDPLLELSATLRSAIDRLGTSEEAAALERLSRLAIPPASPASPQPGPAGGEGDRTARPPASELAGPSAATELLRIPFTKLDALLAQVGELVGEQARLERMLRTHRAGLERIGARRELEELTEELSDRIATVRETTMDLRLVPLHTIFGRFPVLVRELARAEAKEVRLEVSGDSIQLDKSTADILAEPILHLLRNAIDHGIETPEERARQGKTPRGTIWLHASRRADQIRIEVRDDGRGLDRAAIRERARAMGSGAPEPASDEELLDFIFRPGFSTRREVSTLSGRGLGLDIVRQSVTRLRGTLSVEDRPGGGTAFVLQLPLTLAIVPVLLFEAEGEPLALPALDVREALPAMRPERAAKLEVIRYDDQLIPFVRAGSLLGWSERPRPGHDAAPRGSTIVIRRGRQALALAADRLLDQRSLMVKALPSSLGRVPAVAGAAVGPDGRIVLLLDSQGLLDLTLQTQRRSSRVE